MKKLLFAIAGAASFAVLAADPSAGANDISIVGFENYTADQTVIGYGDNGVAGDTLWSCAGDDASLVKTLGGDNAAVPSITEPRPFAGETNTKYLALDTNGSELQRAIPSDQDQNVVPAAGMYIDTLVQFTPSESAPTSADLTGAKLAIWLGVENNVTNLYVQGNAWDWDSVGSDFTMSSQAYALTGKTIEPGTWYRLTVKAIPNVLSAESPYAISAFQIFVDGTEMAAATAPISSALQDAFHDAEISYASADIGTAIQANKLIPAIQSGIGDPADTVTLTSVGFKGTGALDDFVVTTEAPEFGPAAIDFSLTWPAGLTAVSYTIDGGEPVAISGASPLSIPNLVGGEAITFIVQNADGAQKTLSATAANGEGIDATGTTFGWPEYLGEAVNGAYEIDNLAELKLFQKGVANTSELTTVSTTFKLTADVTLDEAWPGIGIQNAKDLVSYKVSEIGQAEADRRDALFAAAAFMGTFDGQNHTVSGFQMVGIAGNPANNGEGLDYAGFFNCANGATIQNLKIQYAGGLFAVDTTASSKESGATFVGVAKNSTLQNLTTVAGSVSCSKGFGGIVGYLTTGSTVQFCTNNVNLTSLANNKAGGIAMIRQGSGSSTIANCQNNGAVASTSAQHGGIVGYVDGELAISNCENTVAYKVLHNNSGTITVTGENKGHATVKSYTNRSTPNLNFATVSGSVATFVADNALAAGETPYKVMSDFATATYEFTAAGSISFDTNMIQAVTFAITAAQGLDAPTEATENGVVTFTVAAAGGDDYVVEIEGSDVVITPQAGDLEALAEAGVDTNSVAAVNAALATTIEGTSIPAWQALFLGVAPTTNGLETVAIKSISIAADGTVTVEMADGVTLKTGRGVDIKLKLMGSTDLTNWTQIGSDITNTKVIPAITPAQGETKKFYKVVVDFAGSSAQN